MAFSDMQGFLLWWISCFDKNVFAGPTVGLEALVDSLSCENLSHDELNPDQQSQLTAFRRLNRASRFRAARKALDLYDKTMLVVTPPPKDELQCLREQVVELTAEKEMWKKRAEQHGCNVEEGDHECG